MIGAEKVMQLIGKSVELICFAQHSMYIHLQDRIILTVESGLEHVHNGTRHVHQLSSPLTESNLLAILEATVTSATVATNGDLELTISNGDKVRLYKEPQYESYRLKMGTEELIA